MDDDEGRTVSMRQYTLACNQATDLQRQLQQAQDRLTTKLGEVNTTNRLNTDVLRRERDVAIGQGMAVIQAARILACQRHMARLSQGWWYRRFGEVQEWAEEAEAQAVELRGYVQHKPECAIFHFQDSDCDCGLCGLLTPTEARSPQSGQEEGDA